MAPKLLTPAERQLLNLIPAGSCRPAADPAPFADAVAALDLFQQRQPRGVLCTTINGKAAIADTNNRTPVLCFIEGPDLASLYQWWTKNG